jgi:hypothetical protein
VAGHISERSSSRYVKKTQPSRKQQLQRTKTKTTTKLELNDNNRIKP